MIKRQLGKTNMYVSPIGLGCMGFSHAYGLAEDKERAIQTIKQAYKMGYNFFDTAECYTGENTDGTISYNEELVGEALKEVREQVVKFWCNIINNIIKYTFPFRLTLTTTDTSTNIFMTKWKIILSYSGCSKEKPTTAAFALL